MDALADGVFPPEIEKLLKISRAGVSNAVKRIENKIEEDGKCRTVIKSGKVIKFIKWEEWEEEKKLTKKSQTPKCQLLIWSAKNCSNSFRSELKV